MLRKIRRTIRRSLSWIVWGEQFKRYVRPGPSPAPGSKLRIAICYLIPNLGDAVMVFPLLDALRAENPEAEITCFTYGAGGQVLGLHPALDHHYNLPRIKGVRGKVPPAVIYDIWSWRKKCFPDLQFDLCLTLRGGGDPFYSTHLAWLLGGCERIGYSSKLEPERYDTDLHGQALLTKMVDRLVAVHEVARGAEVLILAGLIHQQIDIEQPVASVLQIAHGSEGQAYIAGLPELDRPYGIIAPGSSTPRRQWPAERFAELTEREIVSRGWLPVFVGGPEVAATCDEIARRLTGPCLNLAGRTNFQHLAAVCARASCFVGNDSGTAHIAGACGVPVLIVTAFAKMSLATHHASPNRSLPVGPYGAVVQPTTQLAPCTEECLAEEPHCILQVEVADVQAAFTQLMLRSGRETMSQAGRAS